MLRAAAAPLASLLRPPTAGLLLCCSLAASCGLPLSGKAPQAQRHHQALAAVGRLEQALPAAVEHRHRGLGDAGACIELQGLASAKPHGFDTQRAGGLKEGEGAREKQ